MFGGKRALGFYKKGLVPTQSACFSPGSASTMLNDHLGFQPNSKHKGADSDSRLVRDHINQKTIRPHSLENVALMDQNVDPSHATLARNLKQVAASAGRICFRKPPPKMAQRFSLLVSLPTPKKDSHMCTVIWQPKQLKIKISSCCQGISWPSQNSSNPASFKTHPNGIQQRSDKVLHQLVGGLFHY